MKIRLLHRGIEILLWRSQIDEPEEDSPNVWTVWETVSFFIRRLPRSKGEPKIYKWRYDGRRRFTAYLGPYRIDLWRDCYHTL